MSLTKSHTASRGSATVVAYSTSGTAVPPSLRLRRGVAPGEEAERHRRGDRRACARVTSARHAGHHVAGRVEAGDGRAVDAENLRVRVHARAALRTDGAGVDL